MIDALIITLREGLEAALVIGLILVYLRRIGRTDLSKFAYIGLILAIIASGIGAFIFQTLSLGENVTDVIEAYIMLFGAFFVGTMVVWMFKASKSFRHQVEQRIDTIANKKTTLTQGLGLLLLSFMMVFREGAEIILFLAALSFSAGSNLFLIVSGGAIGIAIAAILGILIIKGLVKINLRLFFAGTGLVLLALMATLVAKALHNLAEFNVVSLTPDVLAFVGLLAREDTSIIILFSLIAIPALLIALDPILSPHKKKIIEDESPAQKRLRVAEARRSTILRALIGVTLFAVIMTVGFSWASTARGGYDPAVMPINSQNGKVMVPLSELNDGIMHKYSLEIQGVPVRFFMIHPSGDTVRVGFDACYICPPIGYYMKEGTVVCKNCDAPINFDSIGLPGGCNPRVLEFTVDDTNVVIDLAELEASVKYFG